MKVRQPKVVVEQTGAQSIQNLAESNKNKLTSLVLSPCQKITFIEFHQLLLFPSCVANICTKTHCNHPKRQEKLIGYYVTMAARELGNCQFCTLILFRKALGTAYKKGHTQIRYAIVSLISSCFKGYYIRLRWLPKGLLPFLSFYLLASPQLFPLKQKLFLLPQMMHEEFSHPFSRILLDVQPLRYLSFSSKRWFKRIMLHYIMYICSYYVVLIASQL